MTNPEAPRSEDPILQPVRAVQLNHEEHKIQFGELAVKRIVQAVNESHPLDGFTPQALAKLAAITEKTAGDLGVSAAEFARKRNQTVIDVPDVTKADSKARGTPLTSWLFGIGGLLIGAATAIGVTLMSNPESHNFRLLTIIGIVCFLLGVTIVIKTKPQSQNR
ncbi:hypothetical protein [Nocardia sp. NPDC051832]|uniref:hypothetical protein n=1 Tax=Nocardia sp. NPDC051832 TaxID=3155673 RepID=UPI003416B7EA